MCVKCKRSQQRDYTYNAYCSSTNLTIYKLLINSSGMSDISRVLSISRNTVTSRILKMAKHVKRPLYLERFQTYEVDEMFVKRHNGRAYLSYAINNNTLQVIDFVVGRRTDKNIGCVVKTVLSLYPKMIYSDGYPAYKRLVPKKIHTSKRYKTNKIERFHLTLRTHIKRLSRKTLCYSKNIMLLSAIMRIYFWGSSHQIKNI